MGESQIMSDEDFFIGGGRTQLPECDDVEQMLEILMKIAQSDGREFLAYLLSMALIEARNRVPPKSHLSH